ncbi:MAG: hypothetical protein ACR2GZ_10185 [Solirubrobacteraceae bacterium]
MASLSSSPIPTLRGRFTERHAATLLCGPGSDRAPGKVRALAARGLEGAVASLTRPSGAPRLIGAAPHDDHGRPLDPINALGS